MRSGHTPAFALLSLNMHMSTSHNDLKRPLRGWQVGGANQTLQTGNEMNANKCKVRPFSNSAIPHYMLCCGLSLSRRLDVHRRTVRILLHTLCCPCPFTHRLFGPTAAGQMHFH